MIVCGMQQIPLGIRRPGSPQAFALVSDEDYGELARYRWHLSSQGYAVRKTRVSEDPPQKVILMHREVLGLPRNPGRGRGLQGNHINFNQLDNRRENLEVVTPGQNLQHRWDRDKRDACPQGHRDWSYTQGTRRCLACKREKEKARAARLKQDPEWVEQNRAYKREKNREYLQDPDYRERQLESTRRWRARQRGEAT